MMQSGGMQVEDSMMDNQVDANTLRTLAAILRQAEATAGARGADPGALTLSELITASKMVLANVRPPDDVNRFVCYRALLKLAADPSPNWWGKLTRLSAVSGAGVQDEDEAVAGELESSLVAAVSFWAHGHMRSCFWAWHQWTSEASTYTFKLHTIVRCAARVLPRRMLLMWRSRLSVYGGEGDEHAQENLLRVFDRIWRVRFIHAWAKHARGQHQARIHASLKQRSRVLTKLYWHARARQWKRMSMGLSHVLRGRLRASCLKERLKQWVANRFARKGARILLKFVIETIKTFLNAWKRRTRLLIAFEAVQYQTRRPRLRNSMTHWKILYRERWRSMRDRRGAIERWIRYTRRRVNLRTQQQRAENFKESRALAGGLHRWYDWGLKHRTITAAEDRAARYRRTSQLSAVCDKWRSHFEHQQRTLRAFADIFTGAVTSAYLASILTSWRALVVYQQMLATKMARGLFSSGVYLQKRCLRALAKYIEMCGFDKFRMQRNIFRGFRLFIAQRRIEKEDDLKRASNFAIAKGSLRVLRSAQNFAMLRKLRRQSMESAMFHWRHTRARESLLSFQVLVARHRYQAAQLDAAKAQNASYSKRCVFRQMHVYMSRSKDLSEKALHVMRVRNFERSRLAWSIWCAAQKQRWARYLTAAALLHRTECRLRLGRWDSFRRKRSAERNAYFMLQSQAQQRRATRAFIQWRGSQLDQIRQRQVVGKIIGAWIQRYMRCGFQSWLKLCQTLRLVSTLFEKRVLENSSTTFDRIKRYSKWAKAERLASMAVERRARLTSWRDTWTEWRKQFSVMKCARRLGGKLTEDTFKAWKHAASTARRERDFVRRARVILQENRSYRGIWRRVLSIVVSRALNSWIHYLYYRRTRRWKVRRGEIAHTRKIHRQALIKWRKWQHAERMFRMAKSCDAYLTKRRMWPWFMLALEISLREASDMRRAVNHWSYHVLRSSITCWLNHVEISRYERARIQVLVHAEALHILGAAVFAWRSFCQRRADLTRRAHTVALIQSDRMLGLRFRSWNQVYRFNRHCREIADVRMRIQASLFRLKLQRILTEWSAYCAYQARMAISTQLVEQRHQRVLSINYLHRWHVSLTEAMKQYQPSERWRRVYCQGIFQRLSEVVSRRRKEEYALDQMQQLRLTKALAKIAKSVASKRMRRSGLSSLRHLPWHLNRWSLRSRRHALAQRRADACALNMRKTKRKSTLRTWRKELKCRVFRYGLLCGYIFRTWIRYTQQNIEERANLKQAEAFLERKAIMNWISATHASVGHRQKKLKLEDRYRLVVTKRRRKTLHLMVKHRMGLGLMRYCFDELSTLVTYQREERRRLQGKQEEALKTWVSFHAHSRRSTMNMARALSFRRRRRQKLGFEKLQNWGLVRCQASTLKAVVRSWHWANILRRMLAQWRIVTEQRKMQALVDTLNPPVSKRANALRFEGKFILRYFWANWTTRAAVSRIESEQKVGVWLEALRDKKKQVFMAYWKTRKNCRDKLRTCIKAFQARYWRRWFSLWRGETKFSPRRALLLFRWRQKRLFTTWKIQKSKLAEILPVDLEEIKERNAMKHFKRQLTQRFFILWRVSWWVWNKGNTSL